MFLSTRNEVRCYTVSPEGDDKAFAIADPRAEIVTLGTEAARYVAGCLQAFLSEARTAEPGGAGGRARAFAPPREDTPHWFNVLVLAVCAFAAGAALMWWKMEHPMMWDLQ